MYLANNVPYIGLRSFPVVIGSLVPVVVYAIMRESGYPAVVGLFSTALVLLGELCRIRLGVQCDWD
jgi:dolichyl-phosphate-mannose-protein mannosyltransferase